MTSPHEQKPGSSSGKHDQADLHTYDAERKLPASHNPLPALNNVGAEKPVIAEEAFMEVRESPEFAELRRRFRAFAFPMTAAFLIWYFAYVLLSVFAKPFMVQNIGLGNLNMGHALGLLQFATTFLITWLYLRHMTKNIDPLARDLRAKLEGGNK
jgi:uncharacterized membrane protein (DUF485 family)